LRQCSRRKEPPRDCGEGKNEKKRKEKRRKNRKKEGRNVGKKEDREIIRRGITRT
jgi:hypothetical protein